MEIGPVGEDLPALITTLKIVLQDPFPGTFANGNAAAYASLASVRSVGNDDNDECFFQLDNVSAGIEDQALKLTAILSTGGDSILLRVNYQVTVLGTLDPALG